MVAASCNPAPAVQIDQKPAGLGSPRRVPRGICRRHLSPVACREFRWPALARFKWARDHFGVLAAEPTRVALRVVNDQGSDIALTYEALSARSRQVAAGSPVHRRGAEHGANQSMD